MKISCLTRYGDLGASSRVRCAQYVGPLASLVPGLQFERQPLLNDHYLRRKYRGASVLADTVRGFARRACWLAFKPAGDIRWVEKELWPYVPAWLERLVLRRRPYVLDLDDAIFHNYDRHRLALVRRLYGRKIDRLMAGATLVTAGNEYLAERARAAHAMRVEILPTVIDLDHYRLADIASRRAAGDGAITIGWIGSPATQHYLQLLAEPLGRLAREHRIRLLVIGGRDVRLPGVDVEEVRWTEETEVASISRIDIGIMPLRNSPWEQGKCGYKLIQYMACGIPVVGSPIAVNKTIVTDGLNGFLAADDDAWFTALKRLATDAALRAEMGREGRRRVEERYCIQHTAPMLALWLEQTKDRKGL